MILLSDWANFRKSAVRVLPEEEDASAHEDEASVANLIELLVDNVQVASRHSQAAQVRLQVKVQLDSLAAKIDLQLQSDLKKLQGEIDRQLKALFSPLLNEHLETKAIEDFCHNLAAAIGKDTSRQLVISAPPELQDRLAARLALTELKTSTVRVDGEEISTSIEATEITTEIGKWKSDLQRLMI
jgi:hypothetical protein